jgi:hypothetical protein
MIVLAENQVFYQFVSGFFHFSAQSFFMDIMPKPSMKTETSTARLILDYGDSSVWPQRIF